MVVEDNELNRDILCDLLSDTYNVLQAENGKEALEILKEQEAPVSAIMLDLQMPIKNGYDFLDALKENVELSKIPVIVMTASNDTETEIKCLELGASDFVGKPFHPDVTKARLMNAIKIRESVETLSVVEYDDLTGLYTASAFINRVDKILKHSKNSRYDIIAADVVGFSSLNEKFGKRLSDKLLKFIANSIKTIKIEQGMSCRYGIDKFVAIVEVKDDKKSGEDLLNVFRRHFANKTPIKEAQVKYAVYENVDTKLSAATLCNRAFITLDSIKHVYGVDVKKYTVEQQKQIDLLSMIENDMEKALSKNEYQVFYQPKINIEGEKDTVGGAEALVRWIHPTCGFMNPGIFIPLFEKNGFITQLDFYVLNKVCADIKEWKAKGVAVYPISINFSRIDFSMPDLAERVIRTVDSYGVPRELIHIEITESAFSTKDDMLKTTIHKLHEGGFVFELDDFGSGYSTLAALQNSDIDIVKLDMSLIKEDSLQSGRSVLNFAHTLVQMMNMKIVQEGVETKEQLERVRALGCNYVQGYYFAKPFKKEEYTCFVMQKE